MDREQIAVRLADLFPGRMAMISAVQTIVREAVEAERKACVEICNKYDSRAWGEPRFNMAYDIADAIRARGN